MELNLGAEAPAAGRPNLAILLARTGAVAPAPQPKPESNPMENTVVDNQPVNDAPSFDEISASIPQPAEAQEAAQPAPNAEPVVALTPQPKPASLPRGAGVVDYRSADMYPATTLSVDELQAAEDTAASGCSVVDVAVPYAATEPALDKDGQPKLDKDGNQKFKKATKVAKMNLILDPDSAEALTDNAAGVILNSLGHTVASQVAKQSIDLPSNGVVHTGWLLRHFNVSTFGELLTSVFMPWTTATSTGKTSVAVQNALLCNAPVDGTSPVTFVQTAIEHTTALFRTHTKNITGKDATATAVKQATAVLEQLAAHYKRFDASMEAYEDNLLAIETAEANGTEVPKAKRKPQWKLPALKSTLPAVKEMIQTLESAAGKIRSNIAAMRGGAIPKGKTEEWVGRYLEIMPPTVEALVYTSCILSATYDKMKADAERRANKSGDTAASDMAVDDDMLDFSM